MQALGSDSKPVCAGTNSSVMPNCSRFDQWFNDHPGVNKMITGKTISLTPDGTAGEYSYARPLSWWLDRMVSNG